MNDESLEKLANHLKGTAQTIFDSCNLLAIETNGLTEHEIQNLLRPWEVGRCECCGWWHESWELDVINEMRDELLCSDCISEQTE